MTETKPLPPASQPSQTTQTSRPGEMPMADRFEFGANWSRFLKLVDEARIVAAEESVKNLLGLDDLTGKTMLDVGSGSGLFSLAARRLGARVHSFDYDPQSVAGTAELKRRYFDGDEGWTVERGSALDADYLESLGRFDIVYSWGVLHHTGAMWDALGLVHRNVAADGRLAISIYNDQGGPSIGWAAVKKLYNRCPAPLRLMLVVGAGVYFEIRAVPGRLLRLLGPRPLQNVKVAKEARGMSVWHDLVDWVGGYPFEVAKPEEIFEFYLARGFVLRKMKTCRGSLGCNEFLFVRYKSPALVSPEKRANIED